MTEVTLPHNYTPRGYQIGMWRAYDQGARRMCIVWHRRAGKDKSCLNLMARESQRRVGLYWYFLPLLAQGRKVIWDGMDHDGFPFIEHFPKPLWEGPPNATLMRLRLRNGSVFQVVGSDSIDNLVGANPVGCVFSEFALQDPRGWDLVRPILRENKGWALFNGTPRGRNHFYRLFQTASVSDDWYAERLSYTDTGVLDADDVQAEIDSGMSKELAAQEFECSWEGGMEGAYYSQLMEQAAEDGRITDVRYDPALPVHTAWDLGVHDMCAIVFFQAPRHLNEIRIIDYLEHSGEGLAYYQHQLQVRNYVYQDHHAPHDIAVRELGSGKSRLETARELGLNFRVAPKLPIEDGINAVRMMLPLCWFDRTKCARLIEALQTYRREKDEKLDSWKRTPVRDWSTHGADAFRTLAVGRRKAYVPKEPDRYRRRSEKRPRYSWMAV